MPEDTVSTERAQNSKDLAGHSTTLQERGRQKSSMNDEDWPLNGAKTLHENDVPLGRGGMVNSHIGHKRYLQMVQDRQLEYAKCPKKGKAKVNKHIGPNTRREHAFVRKVLTYTNNSCFELLKNRLLGVLSMSSEH